jgi:hypothetical protein
MIYHEKSIFLPATILYDIHSTSLKGVDGNSGYRFDNFESI